MIDTETLVAELDAARKEIVQLRRVEEELAEEEVVTRSITEYARELKNSVVKLQIEVARLKQSMPCGHPGACAVSADEGTGHCGACEREQKHVAEAKRLGEIALDIARARESECQQRFERLKRQFHCGRDGFWYYHGENQADLKILLGEE